MVKNLSTSFAGVGLLPPTKDRSHSNSQKQKRKELPSSADIFDAMEPDTLFMILPMWPRETDSRSRSKSYQRPEIPLDERLFLILSYRTSDTQRSQSNGKKVRWRTKSHLKRYEYINEKKISAALSNIRMSRPPSLRCIARWNHWAAFIVTVKDQA